jgi:hypothetical protein
MSGAAALPFPPDEPAVADDLVALLASLAASAGESSAGVGGHRAALAAVWSSPAGAAARAELEALESLAAQMGDALSHGRTHVRRYADALAEARSAVARLQVAWDDEMARSGEPDRRDGALAELRRRYEAVIEELDVVGRSVGAELAALAGRVTAEPGRPSRLPRTVAVFVLAHLSMLRAEQAAAAASEAAAELARALRDGWISEDEAQAFLDAAEDWSGDADFAAALITGLGPEALLDAPMAMAVGNLDEGASPRFARVVELLGTSLAATTADDHESGWWRFTDRLAELGASDYPTIYPVSRFWGLGVLLRHGTHSARFLTTVGGAMYRHARAHPERWPRPDEIPYRNAVPPDPATGERGPHDPLGDLMTALSRNPDAAQRFLLEPDGASTRLDHLLTGRRAWGDPASLGRALEAAAIALPPRLQEAGAEIVARMVNDIAAAGVTHAVTSVGRVLAAWIHDVNFTLMTDVDAGPAVLGDWVDTVANPMLPLEVQPPFHAVLDRRALVETLGVVSADGRAYRAIVDAEAVYARTSIDAHRGDIELSAGQAASLLGEVAEIHHDALARAGVEATPHGHDRVIALAQAGTALIGGVPVAGPVLEFGANLVIEAIDAPLDATADSARADHLDVSADVADEERVQVRRLVADLVVNAMIDDPGAAADAGAWLAARPRLEPSSWFVDPATGALQADAASPAGRRALAAWLHDPEPPGAGRTIGAVLARADLEFSGGQVRGGER